MTPLEATSLCRFTKAVCPQQAIDEYTPDAWHLLLEDIRFVDAQAAVIAAAKVKPFVSPAEIREHVRHIRGDRLLAFGHLPDPPHGMTDAQEIAWIADLRTRIADGEDIPRPVAIEPSPEHIAKRDELLNGVGQEVPDVD